MMWCPMCLSPDVRILSESDVLRVCKCGGCGTEFIVTKGRENEEEEHARESWPY